MESESKFIYFSDLTDEQKQSILQAKEIARDFDIRTCRVKDRVHTLLFSMKGREVNLPEDPESYRLHSQEEMLIYDRIQRIKEEENETNERIKLLDKSKLNPIDERVLCRHIEESTQKMDKLLLQRVMRIVFTIRDVDNTIIDRFIQHWSKVEGVYCYISDKTDVVVLW